MPVNSSCWAPQAAARLAATASPGARHTHIPTHLWNLMHVLGVLPHRRQQSILELVVRQDSTRVLHGQTACVVDSVGGVHYEHKAWIKAPCSADKASAALGSLSLLLHKTACSHGGSPCTHTHQCSGLLWLDQLSQQGGEEGILQGQAACCM